MNNKYEVVGETTKIFLKRADGEIITSLISTSDLEKLLSHEYSWFAHMDNNNKYYVWGHIKENGKAKKIKLHRYLTKCPDGMVVDHINCDTLDNRQCNLRITDKSGNAQNTLHARPDSTSGHRNITWSKQYRGWRIALVINGKQYNKFTRDFEKAKNIAKEMQERHFSFYSGAKEAV